MLVVDVCTFNWWFKWQCRGHSRRNYSWYERGDRGAQLGWVCVTDKEKKTEVKQQQKQQKEKSGEGYRRVRPPASSWPSNRGESRGTGPTGATAAAAPGLWGSASGSCARWSNEWTSEGPETTWDWCPVDFEEERNRRKKRREGLGGRKEGKTEVKIGEDQERRWHTEKGGRDRGRQLKRCRRKRVTVTSAKSSASPNFKPDQTASSETQLFALCERLSWWGTTASVCDPASAPNNYSSTHLTAFMKMYTSYFGFSSGSGSFRPRPTGLFSASSAVTRWSSASTLP